MAPREQLDNFSSLATTASLLSSSPDPTAPITQSSTFLTIPPEIRNDIYERAFDQIWTAGTNYAETGDTVDLMKAVPPSKAPLLACRQMFDEAKGLYKTAYRAYWSEVHFTTCIPEQQHKLVAHFREDDLHRIRHLRLHITFQQMHMLMWSQEFVSSYLTPTNQPSDYLDYDRVATGQWLLSNVNGKPVNGRCDEDYDLVMEFCDYDMYFHDGVKLYARGHAFKSVTKEELEAIFERNLQLGARQE
ncbi:hypothetical protein LTR10_010910 [Elasticomyces elasticus]|nr:hypothetical protein LTR10_010910 [Elasticomyces elasticus]KAK4968515.1 hypothetical protein LTR42_009798 [Elasticomyces elasticus]